ncbi:MAG TPA: O-antigen ligase family protein [Candidatus Eisenbacteria bacterium]|nr:O-antigen ligase family protein [Candidatus Eisenbacteria bacterium]
MLNSPVSKLNVTFALCAGLALGVLFLQVLPLAGFHPFFLLAVPLMCLLFLGIAWNTKGMIVLLLFSRVLLDPLLNLTKVDSLGLGFGAVLNLFVLLLTGLLLLRDPSILGRQRLFVRWFFFLAVCMAAAAYSPFPVKAVKLLFNLASYFAMLLLPFLVDARVNDKRFWVKALAASSVLPVLAADVDLMRGGHMFEGVGARVLGTFTHPNILAFYLVWVVALVLYLFKSAHFRMNGWQKAGLLVFLADVFVLLLATKTRNAWISCWLFFFVYGLLKEKKFAVFAVFAAAVALAVPQIASRTSDLSSQGGSLNSFAWRVELWKSSLPSIREKWLLGHGLASFQELSRGFFSYERTHGADAHNTYVQILFESGLVGLLSYLALYASLFGVFFNRVRKGFGRLSAEYAVVLAYLVSYLLSSFADNMFYYLALNWYFWFFVGVMLKATQFHANTNLRNRPFLQRA